MQRCQQERVAAAAAVAGQPSTCLQYACRCARTVAPAYKQGALQKWGPQWGVMWPGESQVLQTCKCVSQVAEQVVGGDALLPFVLGCVFCR